MRLQRLCLEEWDRVTAELPHNDPSLNIADKLDE